MARHDNLKEQTAVSDCSIRNDTDLMWYLPTVVVSSCTATSTKWVTMVKNRVM